MKLVNREKGRFKRKHNFSKHYLEMGQSAFPMITPLSEIGEAFEEQQEIPTLFNSRKQHYAIKKIFPYPLQKFIYNFLKNI